MAKANRLVSSSFFQLVFTYFFLIRAKRVFTSMKIAPIIPVIEPKIRADGRLEMGDLSCVTLPNLRTEALERVTSLPWYRFVRIASVSVDIAEAKKTSHSMLNVQKVVGFEISKVKRAPPIGEPKAADTPELAPAAINCRFS